LFLDCKFTELFVSNQRRNIMPDMNRRDALKISASFAMAAAAGGFSCVELARAAAPIEVPTIDKLSVRVLVDSASDIFFKPQEVNGVKTEPGRPSNATRPLHSEWGLSLLLEPQRGNEKRTFLLDFGWTPETINGNMDQLKVDPSKIDTLIMSHGQFDKRSSIEKVLPNTLVEFKLKDGAGCNASHYLPAEMEGKIVPDEHIHEHATCFNLKDKGLIVISSCGHVGIVNSVRQAMDVSGVQKIHAIMGGFHLGPAPADYLTQVVGEIAKLNPDVVIPMHCSGLNFTQEAQRQMPGKVLTTTTGTRISFGV
jgi:metal-dependent hydrolase (beta-lactamase superfamily II)